MTEAWAQIVATIIGGALTGLGGFVAYRMSVAQEREARRVEWERQQIEAERKTLRDLQEALKDIVDTAKEASHALTSFGRHLTTAMPFGEQGGPRFERAISKAEVLRSWIVREEILSATSAVIEAAHDLTGVDRSASGVDILVANLKSALDKTFVEANRVIGKTARSLPLP